MVHGDADAAIPLALGQALAEGLAHADLVVIQGAGHAANLTHPEPVNAAIKRFIEALD